MAHLNVGTTVTITALSVEAIVDAVLIERFEALYRCVYFMNGDRKETWVYEREITV